MKKITALIASLPPLLFSLHFLLVSPVFADELVGEYSILDEVIADWSIKIIVAAVLILLITAVLSLLIKHQGPALKKLLFGAIVSTTVLSTVFLAATTIYINVVSSSGGPVHWHADIEMWNCGEEVELKKPKGLSNKIGTATLHSHDDKRIHLEGVVVNRNNASLGNYFRVIDGQISKDEVTIPAISQNLTLKSGQTCPNGKPAEVQVFAYRVNADNTYYQEKLEDPAEFVIAPHSQVPPGDCIIVEFDSPKDKTDKLCRSFAVAKEINKLGQEVSNGN